MFSRWIIFSVSAVFIATVNSNEATGKILEKRSALPEWNSVGDSLAQFAIEGRHLHKRSISHRPIMVKPSEQTEEPATPVTVINVNAQLFILEVLILIKSDRAHDNDSSRFEDWYDLSKYDQLEILALAPAIATHLDILTADKMTESEILLEAKAAYTELTNLTIRQLYTLSYSSHALLAKVQHDFYFFTQIAQAWKKLDEPAKAELARVLPKETFKIIMTRSQQYEKVVG